MIKIKSTPLIIIDIINSCAHSSFEDKNTRFSNISKMITRLIKFTDLYRQKGGEVIFINCKPWTKKHLAKNIIELYKDPKISYYQNDKLSFRGKFYKIKPNKSDKVFSKNTYDAFTNIDLIKYLKEKEFKYLLITGIFGDGCVNASINGAFSNGFNMIILKDLIETTDDSDRQKLLKYLMRNNWPYLYGKTITSSKFLKSLK